MLVACHSPTGPSSNLDDLVTGKRVQLRLAFVATDIDPQHWLAAGDTVFARLTLTMDPEDEGGPAAKGTILYEGVPLWSTPERPAGTFEGSFYAMSDPNSSYQCVLKEGRPNSSEWLIFQLRAADRNISWTVEWYDSGSNTLRALGVAEIRGS
jgi:hypothetical protein